MTASELRNNAEILNKTTKKPLSQNPKEVTQDYITFGSPAKSNTNLPIKNAKLNTKLPKNVSKPDPDFNQLNIKDKDL